jgi:hypothetical protein
VYQGKADYLRFDPVNLREDVLVIVNLRAHQDYLRFAPVNLRGDILVMVSLRARQD